MRKLFSLLTVFALLLLCSPSFAQVAIRENGGAQIGVASTIDLPCDSGSTITTDGFSYRVGCNANFVMAGVANGGSTSMTTATLAVPTAYAFVRKAIAALAAGSFSAGTLANGVPGQTLTIMISTVGASGTYTVTPALSTGFSSIVFTVAGQSAVFTYVNNTVGWILNSYDGSTTPTVNDAGGI